MEWWLSRHLSLESCDYAPGVKLSCLSGLCDACRCFNLRNWIFRRFVEFRLFLSRGVVWKAATSYKSLTVQSVLRFQGAIGSARVEFSGFSNFWNFSIFVEWKVFVHNFGIGVDCVPPQMKFGIGDKKARSVRWLHRTANKQCKSSCSIEPSVVKIALQFPSWFLGSKVSNERDPFSSAYKADRRLSPRTW